MLFSLKYMKGKFCNFFYYSFPCIEIQALAASLISDVRGGSISPFAHVRYMSCSTFQSVQLSLGNIETGVTSRFMPISLNVEPRPRPPRHFCF
jgi:hypothetical protein